MRSFIFFFFLAAATANVINDGPCPVVNPMSNFDFSRYQGTWYEILRYPNAGEEGGAGKCTSAQYVVNGNAGRARNTHVVDGVMSYITGDITLVEPAKIKLTYSFGGRSKDSYLTILKTDYNNYSLGYSCKYFPENNTHQVFAWVKSRTPVMDPKYRALADQYIQMSPFLQADKYIANDHSAATCATTSLREITNFLD